MTWMAEIYIESGGSTVLSRLPLWYNRGYTRIMKTAISIPDEVFKEAERTAKRLGVSRSELYANAVRDYIERYRKENVTEKLNEVYADLDSSLDSALERMQGQTLDKEDW